MKEWIVIDTKDINNRIIKEFGSKYKFSKHTGINKSTLSRWLINEQIPANYALVFIKNLDIPTDDFFIKQCSFQKEMIENFRGGRL